ncbi:MAG: acetyl-CoA C-acyltransferase [Streptosporangiales bacterium]|nr:acetyl-CoA C-acyltransferase [Streptosporangiales bacterium]
MERVGMGGAVILGGARTSFGRFGGELAGYASWELAGMVIRTCLDDLGIAGGAVGEVILGDAVLASGALVPARRAVFEAGLPQETDSFTVDRACCSGMTAIGLAAQKITAGEHDVVVAGGAQAMSQTPWLLRAPRTAGRPRAGNLEAEDILLMRSPLSDAPIAKYVGEVAISYGVDRAAQDQWAAQSHRRYFAAHDAGLFDDEMRVRPEGRNGPLEVDEQARRDTDAEKLGGLKTVYRSPTVTAGNAPGLNDGAAVVVLASEAYAKSHGLTPLGRVVGHTGMSGAPDSSAYLPAHALQRLLDVAGYKVKDIAVLEINEAFAATALVSLKVLTEGDHDLRRDVGERLNPNGGAVAIGHPTGASGARITLTAALEARRRGGGLAAASVCGGFGQADAILIDVA